MNENIRKVLAQERCKHNMIFEYCHHCQKIEYITEVKVPIPLKNRETGEPKLDKNGKQRVAWLHKEVMRTAYKKYRPEQGGFNFENRKTNVSGKFVNVDSAIKTAPFYRLR